MPGLHAMSSTTNAVVVCWANLSAKCTVASKEWWPSKKTTSQHSSGAQRASKSAKSPCRPRTEDSQPMARHDLRAKSRVAGHPSHVSTSQPDCAKCAAVIPREVPNSKIRPWDEMVLSHRTMPWTSFNGVKACLANREIFTSCKPGDDLRPRLGPAPRSSLCRVPLCDNNCFRWANKS